MAQLTRNKQEEIAFHAWLQLLADEQLAAVPAMRLGVVTDLAVGTAPGGYDHWLRQGMVADRLSVGAPPDPLGPAGQDWGLPPLLPDALTADGYAGFAADLAANMAHAGGIRVDHVMGLHRLFVLPVGAPASAGTYIAYPAGDLLSVLALESRRAGCVVIGEDLGTVEAGVREALADHGILAYRLAWFEHGPAEHISRLAMAAVTTHDLPTVAGAYGGAAGDLDLERLAPVVGDLDPAVALYAHIASSPALLACAALDDVVGATVQPNVPGTVDEFPNWRVPLPEPLESIPADRHAQAVLGAIRRRPGRAGRRASNVLMMDARVAAFLQSLDVERGASRHTVAAYRRDLEELEAYLDAAGLDPDTVTGDELVPYANALTDRGLAPATVRRRLAAARAFLRHRAGEGARTIGVRDVPLPRERRRVPRALTAEQTIKLVEMPDATPLGLRDRAALELLYGAGLRVLGAGRPASPGRRPRDGPRPLPRQGQPRAHRPVRTRARPRPSRAISSAAARFSARRRSATRWC